MNEQNPAAVPPTAPYEDRSTGLTVFGIMTILLGCLAGLFVLLIPLAQMLAPPNTQVGLAGILPAIALYGVLAVALVWLGIGSILARRWARALLLIFSWSWLALGLFEIVFMAFLLPKTLANVHPVAGSDQPVPPLPPAAIDAVMAMTFLVLGVVFVIMPAIWTYFYNSRHVKATCEARDPVPGWTDACPLPVLALSLWACLCLPTMLIMPLTGHLVMPFFGMFLTGGWAVIFCLTLAVMWSAAAWLLYRLDQRGWWLVLITICVGVVSMLVTFMHHDMLEMYRLMNYPQAQIDQIQQSGLFEGNGMVWLIGSSLVPFLGYLFFIKKYFRPKS
jgi:hypothetical protein